MKIMWMITSPSQLLMSFVEWGLHCSKFMFKEILLKVKYVKKNKETAYNFRQEIFLDWKICPGSTSA